jgi:hypothetical protein
MLNRSGREAELKARLKGDKKFLEEYKADADTTSFQKKKNNKTWCLPSAILLLPHLPAIWLIRMIVNAIVKAPHWNSSIRLAAFAFGAPLVYIAILAALSSYYHWWQLALIAVFFLPFTGLLGLYLRDRCRGSAL